MHIWKCCRLAVHVVFAFAVRKTQRLYISILYLYIYFFYVMFLCLFLLLFYFHGYLYFSLCLGILSMVRSAKTFTQSVWTECNNHHWRVVMVVMAVAVAIDTMHTRNCAICLIIRFLFPFICCLLDVLLFTSRIDNIAMHTHTHTLICACNKTQQITKKSTRDCVIKCHCTNVQCE